MDLKIELNASPELLTVLERIADALSANQSTPTPAPVKATRQTKAAKQAEEVVEPVETPTQVDAVAEELKEPEKAVDFTLPLDFANEVPSLVEVRAIAADKARNGKRQEAETLIQSYNVKNITELMSLDPESIIACFTKLQQL